MLDYCINLLEEVRDFSWSSAKASHAVLLCCMEHGEIGSWLDTDKIDRVSRAHAQRQLLSSNHTMLQLDQRQVKPVVVYSSWNLTYFTIGSPLHKALLYFLPNYHLPHTLVTGLILWLRSP